MQRTTGKCAVFPAFLLGKVVPQRGMLTRQKAGWQCVKHSRSAEASRGTKVYPSLRPAILSACQNHHGNSTHRLSRACVSSFFALLSLR